MSSGASEVRGDRLGAVAIFVGRTSMSAPVACRFNRFVTPYWAGMTLPKPYHVLDTIAHRSLGTYNLFHDLTQEVKKSKKTLLGRM